MFNSMISEQNFRKRKFQEFVLIPKLIDLGIKLHQHQSVCVALCTLTSALKVNYHRVRDFIAASNGAAGYWQSYLADLTASDEKIK